MRDKWFSRIGCYSMTLEERGFLATLYAAGDVISAPHADITAVMGEGWMTIAEKLKRFGKVEMESPECGWYTLKIIHPNEVKRVINRRRGK